MSEGFNGLDNRKGQSSPAIDYGVSIGDAGMIREHERVVLSGDLLAHGLKEGDVGTVVHVHPGKKAYEVEFVTLRGETAAIVTLKASAVRPVHKREISHARALAIA